MIFFVTPLGSNMRLAKFQFSIRLLVAVTTLVAVSFAIWLARPTEYIDVEISKSGLVSIGGTVTPQSEIANKVQQEIIYRQYWLQGSSANIRLPADQVAPTRFGATDWFKSLTEAGIEEFTVQESMDF